MADDLPPVVEPHVKHIVISIERTSPNPFDVDVYVDAGDFDVIAARAYLEVALIQLDVPDEIEEEGEDQ